MLVVNSVSKSYQSFEALHRVTFQLQFGDVVGLLGLNGAGKSTLLKGLAGVLPFTSGEVRLGKADSSLELQKLVGYQPERPCLAPSLTVHQQIKTVEEIYGLDRAVRSQRRKELIELLSLQSLLHVPCGELSKGELQRVGFLLSTIHSPKLLLLDEPMSGLDPKQMLAFRKFIHAEKKERITILSTHLLQEVQAVCNKLLILTEGQLTTFKEDLSGESLSHLENYFLQVIPGGKSRTDSEETKIVNAP